MAPKAFIILPLLAPFTLAWGGSTHDLYVRDAIPQPNPYAYEEALAARALAARKVYAAKARRNANGKLVLSRQIKARAPRPNAEPNPEVHAFQQYDAGLFSRDGSVVVRDAYAYPHAVAQPDPEMWYENGELAARSMEDDDDWEERARASRKARKTSRNGRKAGKSRKGKGSKSLKKAKAEKEADEEEKTEAKETDAEKEVEEEEGKKATRSWFSWLGF